MKVQAKISNHLQFTRQDGRILLFYFFHHFLTKMHNSRGWVKRHIIVKESFVLVFPKKFEPAFYLFTVQQWITNKYSDKGKGQKGEKSPKAKQQMHLPHVSAQVVKLRSRTKYLHVNGAKWHV
jgi:hypothetical protein